MSDKRFSRIERLLPHTPLLRSKIFIATESLQPKVQDESLRSFVLSIPQNKKQKPKKIITKIGSKPKNRLQG